ncbi:MAG: nuclear transport factor 2 family protein [Actinomycetota bacterium]|nr:nuclear transport factor 2 family protein [Actinomycetota bacterium]
MADHPNAANLRKGYEAFKKQDLDAISDLFADNITWHVPGTSPLAGDYKGKEEVFGFFMKTIELSGGTFAIDVHDVLANDEHGVALVHVTGERSGKRLDQNQAHVFHVDSDGKATEFWNMPEDLASLDDFWS